MKVRLKEISPSIWYFGIPLGLWVSILVFLVFSSSLTLGLYNWYNLPLFAVPSVLIFVNGKLLKQTIEGLLQSLTDSFDQINEVYVMTRSGMARGGKTLLGTAICYRRSQISWFKLQVSTFLFFFKKMTQKKPPIHVISEVLFFYLIMKEIPPDAQIGGMTSPP